MSKEKAIVHINNVSKMIGSKRIKLSEGTTIHIQNELVLALKELEDWKMSVYATIDLDSLICKLSDDDLSDFMLETFRDRVSDESHVSLIIDMFNVMYDSDKKDALVAMLKDMGDDAKSIIEEYLKSIPSECLQDYETMIRYL